MNKIIHCSTCICLLLFLCPYSIGAPAYQARKMYGDTVPGDITHTDVASKFSEFFKNYIRKLPKSNPNVSGDNVKKLITPLFQVSIYACTSLYLSFNVFGFCPESNTLVEYIGLITYNYVHVIAGH